MATVGLTLTLEVDAMRDAIAQLQKIHARLAKRHGDVFRKMDRMIEAMIEHDDPRDWVEIHWIGGGKMVAAPKGKFTEFLREARQLGVLD